MDTILLKKVAQYIKGSQKIPKSIVGYTDENVALVVEDMINKNIISNSNVVRCTLKEGNYKIGYGDSIPIKKVEEDTVIAISDTAFEKEYGITWY